MDDYISLGILLVLILINGMFSLSEMAMVSSTKARLQKLIEEKRWGAHTALKLHEDPTRFLSTVQVGITTVAILSGALGEGALREPLYNQISKISWLAPYAENLALALTVILITYFSVVLGELVPKRLALLYPESIASLISAPMRWLAFLFSPLIWTLSASSQLILKIAGLNRIKENNVSDEEIRIMMEMGSESGVFHAHESRLVNNVMKLDEMRVGSIMVPRQDIFLIDLLEDRDRLLAKIESSLYTQIVVCRGGFENVLGILHCGDLLKRTLRNQELSLEKGLRPLLYVQESMMLTHLLNHFRAASSDLALIVDEYGDIEGLVTLMDVLTAIVGEFPRISPESAFEAVERNDGSWLIDASIPISQLKAVLGKTSAFPGELTNGYHTLAGMILFYLERLPRLTDQCKIENWIFEVVDMDGSRIDKVLVIPVSETEVEPEAKL